MAAKKGDAVGLRADGHTAPAAKSEKGHWTERVRARARELGLSDADVARRLDLSTTRYANYMGRTREPDLVLFARICRILDTTPDRVLSFDSNPQSTPPEAVALVRATLALRALPPASMALAKTLLEALADDAANRAAELPQVADDVRPRGRGTRVPRSGALPKQ